jgi:pimeloyl-ACP methyl ester carboxylesterase
VAAHLVDRMPAASCLLFGLNPRADDPAKRQGRLDLLHDVVQRGGGAALAPRLAPLAGADPAGARARVLAMAEKATPHIHAQTQLALNRPGALGALERARMPVTLLTGTHDAQAPLALANEAARQTPLAQVVPLPGLGHYALVEDPAACARAVAQLWSGKTRLPCTGAVE